MLSEVEQLRLRISKAIDQKQKSQFGQFFTPASIAGFMAELFDNRETKICQLLDAGAGIGSLSVAFLDRWVSGDFKFQKINLDVFEIDKYLQSCLNQTLLEYKNIPGFKLIIRNNDFICAAADYLAGSFLADILPKYTHVILNPPYKKIKSNSSHRSALRQVGIETVNLYSAFVALSLLLLDEGGQLVAIVPRSFCNGLYFRSFRSFILKHSAIKRIHLFESRNKAFKDDEVLQENIIIRLDRNVRQGPVVISTSTDDSFSDLSIQEYPFERILFKEDTEQFIHVPTSLKKNALESSKSIKYSLSDIKIDVSTGPVVDFRVKNHLRKMPEKNTVPLLYPAHFNNGVIEWPKLGIKKPNAIQRDSETEKWLYPIGFYCVVRRFSAKEEKRRILASVVDPSTFYDIAFLGFENHLNVFHDNKKGLSKVLSYGLTLFLNTTLVDEYFRIFNGHTQINATDLKQLKYPSRENLVNLGEWAINQTVLTQKVIDNKLEILLDE